MRRFLVNIMILALTGTPLLAGQTPAAQPTQAQIQVGRGMSLIMPGLMQIGMQTNFFLQLAQEIRMKKEQVSNLEELAFEFQKYGVQKMADLRVSEAELERLLTRDNIGMEAVREKVKEIEAIYSDVKIRQIESLLEAINTLSHEQHLRIVTLVQETMTKSESQPSRSILN